MPYVMKEYAAGGSTPRKQYFGYKLCSARNVIECAFGRLKARFSCLKRAMDINMDDLPMVIYTCFVLNNYCELNNKCVHEELVRRSLSYDREFQPPTSTNRYSTDKNEAERKRVRICWPGFLTHNRITKQPLMLTLVFFFVLCLLQSVTICNTQSFQHSISV